MQTNWVEQLGVTVTNLAEAANRIKHSDDYYVYLIWKMYTPLPVPFYVGKGHWQRLIKHEMDSESESNIYKTNIIRKHTKLGIQCGYTIFDFFQDEEAALQAEIDLIALIGRFDLKQGPLANRTDGGDGTKGHLALKGRESHYAKPVIADGQRYSCLKDAAESLNIHSGAVSARIKNGWDGYFYEGEGQREQTKEILGRYKKEVVVKGKRKGDGFIYCIRHQFVLIHPLLHLPSPCGRGILFFACPKKRIKRKGSRAAETTPFDDL